MDRELDEIVAESRQRKQGSRNRREGVRGVGGRSGRDNYPRDGVRKSTRDDSRNMDSEWVHDRFEDNSHSYSRSRPSRGGRSGPQSHDSRGTKIRVENIHYELTQGDLEGLFNQIGPVVKVDLLYDRAGRSEGTAYVIYEDHQDAQEAFKQYDGANAKGQPIRLTIMPSAPSRRNPFETAVMPGRPLADRITAPSGRSRSLSPRRYNDTDRGIDRYVPGGGSRSRSPPRRRGVGRRPGARREQAGREGAGGGAGERKARDGRPKKTQEELDAEMADYFAPSAAAGSTETTAASEAVGNDIDMIE